MIKNSTITAIGPVVDRLAAANVALGISDNSILGACFMSGLTPVSDHFEGNTGWTEAWLESLTADTLSGTTSHFAMNGEGDDSTIFIPCSHHSMTMEEASDYVAAIGKSVLATARNVVKPAILQVITDVEETINNHMTPIEPINIIDVRLIKEWEHPIVKNLLSRYQSLPVATLGRNDIPRIAMPADLADHMATGNVDVDKMFQAVLAETGLTVHAVFESIFGGGEVGAYGAEWYIKRNLYLAQLLFVVVASEKPWSNSGLGGVEWSALMNKLANSLGALCNQMYKQFNSDIANGLLFIRSEGNSVWLVGETYDKFLDAGGSPEAIIGKCISKDWVAISSDQILAKKDAYLEAWRGWHAAQRYQEESSKIANIRTAFYQALCKFIENGDKAQVNGGVQDLLVRAANRANALMPSHCNDLSKAAIHVVCDVLYPHLPAKELILRINQLVENGEDGEVAAGTAISEYVNDWIASQILFERI